MAATWFVLRQVGVGLEDVRALGPGWWRPRVGLFLLASAGMAGGILVSAGLWGLMVRELGGGSIPPVRAVRAFVMANLARYVPGKVWQIAGLAMLARREGVGVKVATAAAVLGQLIALGAASVLGAGALVVSGGELRVWGWAALAVVVAGTALASVPPLGRRLARAWFRIARIEEPGDVRTRASFPVKWMSLYLLNWVVYAGSFWLLARSFSVDGSFMEIGAAFAAAYVLGYLAVFAPAGIGVRESFLIVFLGPVAGPGPAGALAVASRIWITGVEVAAAAAVAVLVTSTSPAEDAS